MFKNLKPDIMLDSVFDLTPQFALNNNIKLIIFDIDNTLADPDTIEPSAEIIYYLKSFTDCGVKVAFVSNNKGKRVNEFNKNLNHLSLCGAKKPLKRHMKGFIKHLGLLPHEIILIGDQVFTDVWGANRMGFMSILVTPLGRDETKFVALKRKMEKLIIKR